MLKIFSAFRGENNGSAMVYALLEHVILTELGVKLPHIAKTPNGKPYFPCQPDIHFSLSHTKTHVLCAISDSPVGVDIESPRQISERAVNFFCSPEELEYFTPLELWVLKESYIKLKGGTLPMVKSIRFTRDCGNIVSPDNSVLCGLYFTENNTAAVATTSVSIPESYELITISLDHYFQSSD